MARRPNSEYQWSEDFAITDDVLNAFNINGYILIRGLLSSDETGKLRTALENDEGVMSKSYQRDDGSGRKTRVVLWNQPGKDITGIVARSEKMAGTFEKLLGGEVYHYHSKVILKDPYVGGSHVWHQDYGYWYENGNLYPHMGTAWLAVDKATKENGCPQLLVGSHHAGRVTHTRFGEQVRADMDRVEHLKNSCPHIYTECEPGDCIFFHSNVLHTSAPNNSPNRRWGFLVAYNRADNNPIYKHHHPQYTPLQKVPNDEIAKCSTVTSLEGKDFFLGPQQDYSLQKVTETDAKQ